MPPVQVNAERTDLAASLAAFTRRMSLELTTDALELPGFPDVAMRVRKALSDEDVALEDVVRIVSAEPSLSVRLLQLANSVALNPNAQRVTTLRAAIGRIGFNLARSATIAFAMSQMRRAEAWAGLETQFRTIWEASARLAAMSYSVAKHRGRPDADQALLAGMLHAVGRLFVLTRASQYPVLLEDAVVREEIDSAWHSRAGRVLLSQWKLPPGLLDAACVIGAAQAKPAAYHGATLSDVVLAAWHLANVPEGADLREAAFLHAAPFSRLQIDAAQAAEVLGNSAREIASLRAALAD